LLKSFIVLCEVSGFWGSVAAFFVLTEGGTEFSKRTYSSHLQGGNIKQNCDFSALEYRARTLSRKIEHHIPENGKLKIVTE
jgi:hypothetical protein